jgi:hypothetical protein
VLVSRITFRSRERFHAPTLQFVPAWRGAFDAAEAEQWTTADDTSPALRLVHEPTTADASCVLVAGGDETQRAAVLDELTQTMPPSTVFEEAGAFCQVLERAPSSRIVVLSGELDDIDAESLMQRLAHRHPGLPVVSLNAPVPAGF